MNKKRQRFRLAGWILIGVVAIVPAAQPAWAADSEVVVERVKTDCPEGDAECADRRIQRRIF